MEKENVALKESNRALVRRLMLSRYWELPFEELCTDDVTFDFMCAPPGMPNHFVPVECDRFCSWLRRTVKSWETTLLELYSCPDPGQFFVIRDCEGTVYWGGGKGHFQSRILSMIRIQDGKISYMRNWFDAMAFLRASGRAVPPFRMDLYDEQIDAVLAEQAQEPKPPEEPMPELDTSPEACRQRKLAWLELMRAEDYTKYEKSCIPAPDYAKHIFFAPGDMHAPRNDDEQRRIMIWSELSCQGGCCDRRGMYWETDDPNVWFASTYGGGELCNWLGNEPAHGHYRNTNAHRMIFDDLGRCRLDEEYFNSVNKYNSQNISLPSFPYYY